MERIYEIILLSSTGGFFQERINVKAGENIIDKIQKRTPTFHITSIIEVKNEIPNLEIYRCQGCIEDQPNQHAHMNYPYGCLYQPSP